MKEEEKEIEDYEKPTLPILVRCPVCFKVFKFDKNQERNLLERNCIICPECGAQLVLQPKDPSLYLQSLLYHEMIAVIRKLMKEIG